MPTGTTLRSVVKVLPAMRTLEGAGFEVRRPFPTPSLAMVDPFLLLDEMGPVDLAPGEAKGAPDHPHRGFETVTYVLEGATEHRDSAGHAGRIGPGAVQWMTAGAGVIHSEMPSRELQTDGGRMHGLQLWVNLPAADKMLPPRYQEVRASEIPEVAMPGGVVRVIAGEVDGVRGVVETHTPVTYLHVRLEPGARFGHPVPEDHHVVAYVLHGGLDAGGALAGESELAIWTADGDAVEVVASEGGADFVLLAGRPLREPVARYGPFVMNTREQILEAIDDYQAGRMGRIEH